MGDAEELEDFDDWIGGESADESDEESDDEDSDESEDSGSDEKKPGSKRKRGGPQPKARKKPAKMEIEYEMEPPQKEAVLT